VIFIGIDAAWGDKNETGIVGLDADGRVTDADWAVGTADTVKLVCSIAEPNTLIFIDAPLVVANSRGQRLCEKHVGQRYGKWLVSANSTNTASPRQGGVKLLAGLEREGFSYNDGMGGPPTSGRHVSECYPYTALVGYEALGYDVRPVYKRKPRKLRAADFRLARAIACDDLIGRLRTLRERDPPLHLESHPATADLFDTPSPLEDGPYKHREDLIDAIICAWTASLWRRHGLAACQILGVAPGVGRPIASIIAPARPAQRRPLPAA
jgi:predicted RNase H-like nuclease